MQQGTDSEEGWSRVRLWVPRNPDALLLGFRLILVLAAAVLIGVTDNYPRMQSPVALLLVLALVASLPLAVLHRPQAGVVEWVAAVVLATVPEPASGHMMLYLLAPAAALGPRGGVRWLAIATSLGTLAGVGLILRTAGQFDTGSLIDLVQWSVLALALGLIVSWVQRLRESAADSPMRSYEEALALLTDLASISRRLPTGLDAGTIAQQVLQDCMATVSAWAGVVVTSASAGDTRVVASIPEQGDEWLRASATERLLDRAAPSAAVGGSPRSRQSHADKAVPSEAHDDDARPLSDDTIDPHELVEPLRVGDRSIGFIAMRVHTPVSSAALNEVRDTVRAGAIPLEAALLFSTVRDMATNEERSRVAREIHDGIAQDIAFLGYAADEIVELADDPEIRRLASELRQEISRVVTELRTSVRTLREEVNPEQTLGGSLVAFARRVLHDTRTQVHVSVEESPERLRPDVESELRRIAQEAINNTRRHARAENLWLSCTVAPPHATVVVEDDGTGLGDRREDSYGLEIMSERARRINAQLSVSPRDGKGTVVRVLL